MAKCFYHKRREATGVCVECGKMLCGRCDVTVKGKIYCNPCVEQMFAEKPAAAPPPEVVGEAAPAQEVARPVAKAPKKPVAVAAEAEAVEAVVPPVARAKKRTGLWVGLGVGLAFVFIVVPLLLLVIGALSDGDRKPKVTPGAEAPVVTLQQAAPNNFDLPGEVMEKMAESKKETVIAKGGMELVIPPGAVSKDTRVAVKEFTEPPPVTAPDERSEFPLTIGVSKVFDFGPDGIKFREPVQVTIPYDEANLRPGADEKNITLAYFDGTNWVAIGGNVNTEQNTVSIRTAGFPGVPIAALLPYVRPVALYGGLAVSVWLAYQASLYQKARNWWEAEDFWGNAHKYITPDDQVVREYANEALIVDYATYQSVPLQDPQNPNRLNPKALQFIKTQIDKGGLPKIAFDTPYGWKGSTYKDPTTLYHVWQKPADYFNGGMKGNCVDTANAYLSVLRASGIRAKAVDGYTSTGRHCWVDANIGGKVYYLDNADQFEPIEKAEARLKLIRPTDKWREGFQWDEKGQHTYWGWSDLEAPALNVSVTPSVLGPAQLAILTVCVYPPEETRITVDGMKKSYATRSEDGCVSIDYPIPGDTLPGKRKIVVRAPDLVLENSNNYITVKGIQVSVQPKQVQPKGTISATVKVYPEEETQLEVTAVGQKYSKTTDTTGSTTLTIAVPEQAKPGQQKVIVRAPKLNLTAEDSFTVAAQILLPAINSFTASPSSITAGGSSTLSWSTSGAASVSIGNQSVSVSGSGTVTPTQTTTYTLTARNAAGDYVTMTVTVTVGAPEPEPPKPPPPTPPITNYEGVYKSISDNGVTRTAADFVVSGNSIKGTFSKARYIGGTKMSDLHTEEFHKYNGTVGAQLNISMDCQKTIYTLHPATGSTAAYWTSKVIKGTGKGKITSQGNKLILDFYDEVGNRYQIPKIP